VISIYRGDGIITQCQFKAGEAVVSEGSDIVDDAFEIDRVSVSVSVGRLLTLTLALLKMGHILV